MVQFLHLLALFLGLHGDVLGDVIDVGHNVLNRVDVLIALVDDLLHEVTFPLDVDLNLTKLLLLLQLLFLDPIGHKLFLV